MICSAARQIHADDGTFLGGFYTDWFPRKEKRQGAWMNDLRSGGPLPDGGFDPHLGVICGNFTPPQGDEPSLLTHREVERRHVVVVAEDEARVGGRQLLGAGTRRAPAVSSASDPSSSHAFCLLLKAASCRAYSGSWGSVSSAAGSPSGATGSCVEDVELHAVNRTKAIIQRMRKQGGTMFGSCTSPAGVKRAIAYLGHGMAPATRSLLDGKDWRTL